MHGRRHHSEDDDPNQNQDVYYSSSRRSSLTSGQAGAKQQTKQPTISHPHKLWKPFSFAPTTVSRTQRRNSTTAKMVPPRITKTQYPENV